MMWLGALVIIATIIVSWRLPEDTGELFDSSPDKQMTSQEIESPRD